MFRVRSIGLAAALILPMGLSAVPATASHDPADSSAMVNLFHSPTGFTNSDMAFWGDRAYQGYYSGDAANTGGFRIFDVSDPSAPVLLKNYECDGPQNDPVIWQNKLLFLAVDRTMANSTCTSPRTAHDDPNGWEGVRIFDVSDPTNPVYIKGVYTDCGAHTITLWPKNAGQLLLYVSSYPLRPGPTCGSVNGPAAGRDPNHGVIQVIRVPVNNPGAATEIAEPKINYPGDPDNKFIPSEHGLPGPPVLEPSMRACHDIAVFVELRLAAGACAEQAQLWQVGANGIPNTSNPLWVYDEVFDDNGATKDPEDPHVAVDFWHSATFSWDGSVVNFIDESFADPAADNCTPVTPIKDTTTAVVTPSDTGRMFFLNTATGAKYSHFMLPAPRSDEGTGACYNSAHLGNTAVVGGKDLLINAWYMGGVNVVDFSDPSSPVEVAHYDADPDGATGSDNWSAYWYQGPGDVGAGAFPVYATDGVHSASTGRGFQTFKVSVGDSDFTLDYLNPQTMEEVFP